MVTSFQQGLLVPTDQVSTEPSAVPDGTRKSALAHNLAGRVGGLLSELEEWGQDDLRSAAEAPGRGRVIIAVDRISRKSISSSERAVLIEEAAPADVRIICLRRAPTSTDDATVNVHPELTPVQQVERLLPALGWRACIDESAPLFGQHFDAVLCDMDGTLIDSTASVNRSWLLFTEHYGADPEALHANHGQPAKTLISRLLPPELHEDGYQRITALEVADAAGLTPVLGADEFYLGIPQSRRAMVTSGSVAIATARRRAAGFPLDDCIVTVEDVKRGKPDPEPYLVAARQLGVDPARCLAVEDAPAGIASARAAGCAVLAVTGTLAGSDLDADLVVDGLDRVSVFVDANGHLGLRPAQ